MVIILTSLTWLGVIYGYVSIKKEERETHTQRHREIERERERYREIVIKMALAFTIIIDAFDIRNIFHVGRTDRQTDSLTDRQTQPVFNFIY